MRAVELSLLMLQFREGKTLHARRLGRQRITLQRGGSNAVEIVAGR
jgi:hypothetical protein